jgi:hypothetical protein
MMFCILLSRLLSRRFAEWKRPFGTLTQPRFLPQARHRWRTAETCSGLAYLLQSVGRHRQLRLDMQYVWTRCGVQRNRVGPLDPTPATLLLAEVYPKEFEVIPSASRTECIHLPSPWYETHRTSPTPCCRAPGIAHPIQSGTS